MSDQPTPANLAVLATPPGPGSLPLLGMRSQEGRPAFTTGPGSLGCWTGLGHFDGPAQPVDAAGHPIGFEQQVEMKGTFALAVSLRRVLVILEGDAPYQPAVWFGFDRSGLRYRATGNEGLLRKQPTFLTIATPDTYFDLTRVGRVFERSGRSRTRQLPSLLAVLGVPP